MNDVFLKACRGEKTDFTPVWLMRQAGRYLPEYQDVRKQVDFLTLCKTPDLAAKVTLQPVEILGVDAAILFSDILIAVEAMGMKLEFIEGKGPVFNNPIRNKSAVEKLKVPETEESMHFVVETIKILRRELENKIPLIGFSGAPFTLAAYMIEGGSSKDFINTKKMMFQDKKLFVSLMKKLTRTVIGYLLSQINAGVQAVQIFDSWAGILSPSDYKEFALPQVKKIINVIKEHNGQIPVIYYANNCAGIIRYIKQAGNDVVSVDWKIDIADAIKRLGKNQVIQGNLDPAALFLPKEKIEEKVQDILVKAEDAKAHIFNLGSGILPDTPVENAVALVDSVHNYSRRK